MITDPGTEPLAESQGTTFTADFPTELWLEVLAYLPRKYIYKIMGLNRMLFHLALQDKYNEIRLIDDDADMFRTLEQLSYRNIASLVRKLHLRPAFLPGMDEEREPESPLITSFSWLTIPLARLSQHEEDGSQPLHVSTKATCSKVLTAATKALPNCTNLREITIIIYDHLLTPEFHKFLSVLWQTMGDGIQKITISTTLSKIPDLLKSVGEHAKTLPNLECLDLTIVNSRFPLANDTLKNAIDVIVETIDAFKASLTHLTLSSANPDFDHTPLFAQLASLPLKLRRLELWFLFTPVALSSGVKSLVHFLRANSTSLEHLVVQPRPRFEIFVAYPSSTVTILPPTPLPLSLPHVRTLDIGFRKHTTPDGGAYYQWLDMHFLPPSLLSPLLPRLRKLILTSNTHSLRDLVHVLDKTDNRIEALESCVTIFSQTLLDTLVLKCPRLSSLKLTYDSFSLLDSAYAPTFNAQIPAAGTITAAYADAEKEEEQAESGTIFNRM